MEEERAKSNRVMDMVLALTTAELDAFLANVVVGGGHNELATEQDSHWHFCAFEARERANREKGLMYALKSYYLNARRIMCILYYRTDPVYERNIDALCGDDCCLNPLHMRLIK
jgi:hypothetical protein